MKNIEPINIFDFDGIYGTPIYHNEQGLIAGIGEVMTDDKKILAYGWQYAFKYFTGK